MPGGLARGTPTNARRVQTKDHLSVSGRGAPNAPGRERPLSSVGVVVSVCSFSFPRDAHFIHSFTNYSLTRPR
eukprot:11174120-Lingulodinium_polyedra.AAC.1